ncbi:MAG: VCBS repeat-containing protein [Saprospiraceae bacterium]|nr:VCBS repeat-containing protein [Saprospiraceae bacterium]
MTNILTICTTPDSFMLEKVIAMSRFLLLFFPVSLLLPSCRESSSSPDNPTNTAVLFEKLSPEQTGVNFVNKVEDGEVFNVLTYRNFYNGGGVAIGDVNNDGLPDIYLTANMQPNRLYLNKGNWKFEDVTEKAGVAGTKSWSTGVAMADVNGDGWLDIYVCNSGDIAGDNKENELFINTTPQTGEKGGVTFSEQAKAYNLNDEGFTTHASFFDYDLDGDLDCYILNNSYKNPERIDAFKSTRLQKDPYGGDKLFRNDGGTFTNVTDEAGIFSSAIGFGLGVSVSDLNGDMRPDIYISNDFWERDYLYLNQGKSTQTGSTTFSEELPQRVSLCSVSSMGADIADLNNDGACDVFSTDMLPADNHRLKTTTVFDPYHLEDFKYRADYHYQILQNCLQMNDGNAQFQEISNLSGVSATDWSWGALIFDFDNNGWKDIYVCNAIYHEIMYLDFTNFINDKEEVKKVVMEKGKFDWRDFAKYMQSNPLPNYAFVNQLGAPNQKSNLPLFSNQAKALGLGDPGFSNGAAYGDLDGDGDLDMVVNNVNMPCFIYRNETNEKTKNHYLKIKFEGEGGNRLGIGASVTIRYAGQTQVLQHFPQRGFQSSVEPGLLFGLGQAQQIESLEIIWPDLRMQVLKNVPANQTLTLKQAEATELFSPKPAKPNPLFQEITQAAIQGNTRHRENRFSDFDVEVLLPRMLSTDSPKIIRGDLNGDGQEDFVLTGASGDPDKMFFQKNGAWKEVTGWQSAADQDLETTCGLIFDGDGDGDQDLLLGAGGNEYYRGIEHFRLRFYENQGKGVFKNNPAKVPPATGMISCMVPGDIDNDGDSDLFMGGRAVPGNYGLKPRSFLLLNEGNGRWRDVTNETLGNLGMVTDAVFADTDRDGDQDLMVIGDWLPVMHFDNLSDHFAFSKKQTQNPFSGWWTCIEPADLDGDGDLDFVLGNWGLNSKFKASGPKPITMYAKDFDDNGKSEFVINWYAPLDDLPYPFAGKIDMTQQVPSLKKKALKFEDYSKLTYETMFSEAQRKNAVEHKINWLQSAIVWDEGGTFRLEALSLEAQVAPVFGIAVEDFDGDGFKDIWLGGNFYGLKPEVGRHDSSRGVFLKGNKNKTFQYLPPKESGLFVKGEIRDAAVFKMKNDLGILIARNDSEALFYKAKRSNFK